jgi:hypothetical protein
MVKQFRIARIIAYGLCITCSVTPVIGCGQIGNQSPLVLRSADLVTTWSSAEGGSVTFAKDHHFTAKGLRLRDLFANRCPPTATVSGTWEFLGSDGTSGPSLTSHKEGRLIDLSFDSSADYAAYSCTGGGITLTSWSPEPPLTLCIDVDPDTPRGTGYVFEKK